jgi:hypothetical protein
VETVGFNAQLVGLPGLTQWAPLEIPVAAGPQQVRWDWRYLKGPPDPFIPPSFESSHVDSLSFAFPEASYEAWAENSPSLGAAQAPDEDSDGDGGTNMAEFATGTDPANGAAVPHLEPAWNGNKLTITLPKATAYDTTGVSRLVEISNDFLHWTTQGVTIVEETAAHLKVEVDPITAGPSVFARGKFWFP